MRRLLLTLLLVAGAAVGCSGDPNGSALAERIAAKGDAAIGSQEPSATVEPGAASGSGAALPTGSAPMTSEMEEAAKRARERAAAELGRYPSAPQGGSQFRQARPTAEEDKGKPLPFDVQVPDCARRGDVLKATVRTLPDTDIAMMIAFSDRKSHGSETLGTTDADGVFVAHILIDPTAPAGTAWIAGIGAKPEREGHDQQPFEVVLGSCS